MGNTDDQDNAPDWQFWRHMPEVKLWQAVVLSLNENPDRLIYTKSTLHGETVDGYFSKNRDATKRIRLLIASHFDRLHFSAGTLNMGDPRLSGVRLPEFAAWALSVVEWEGLPPELVAMAQKREAPESQPSPAKVGAGDTATEVPQERRTRLISSCSDKRAAGVKAWKRETAREEGISVQMLDKIIRRETPATTDKAGTIEGLRAFKGK